MSIQTPHSPLPNGSKDRSPHDNDYFTLSPVSSNRKEPVLDLGPTDSDVDDKMTLSVKVRNNPAVSRPGLHEKTLSTSSLRRSQLISSPKTPSRNLLPFPQQGQKTTSATALPAFKSFKLGTTDKKLLVEQFYSSINEPKHRVNAVPEPPQPQEKEETTDELTSKEFEVSKNKELEFKNASFDDSFTQGELAYLPLDNHIIMNDNLTNYLLNIDLVTNEIIHQKNQDFHSHYNIRGIDTNEDAEHDLQPLLNILQNVTTTLKTDLQQEITKKTENIGVPPSIIQLLKLSTRLSEMQKSITEVFDDLFSQKDEIKSKYRDKINQNVNKLHELVVSLESLEYRLTEAKNAIKQNKQIMSEELIEKFETLEYIDEKLANHAKLTRDRRFKQLNIGLAVLVVVFSIYMALLR